jgi:hypothetical protein
VERRFRWLVGLVAQPIHKADIELGIKEEFGKRQSTPLPRPEPVSIVVFGDVVITYYLWPEANQASPSEYRITLSGRAQAGRHIIGGMGCPVPRPIADRR